MAWYDKLFGGGKSKSIEYDVVASGGFDILQKLNGPTAMSKSDMLAQYRKSLYVFACIYKIAQKTASIEFEMYQVLNSKGDTKEVITHPALDLLYRVNPFQTKTEFLEKTMINLKTTGDAFWLKVRNKGGKVIELWNLRPDWVSIVASDTNFISKYEFRKPDGVIVDFPPEDIIHHQYTNPLSDYFGMSPLVPVATRVQTEEFAARYQRDFFINSARPDAIIKNANSSLTKEQKEDIKEGWKKKYQGPGNNSKIAILSGGLDYEQISISQKEMDFIESQKFNRDDILTAFQVPKNVLSIVEDVNRANAETGLYIFLSETIKPEMMRLVEKINEELIYPDFGDNFYISFVDPTPANRELMLKEFESGLQNNYMVINEVRQELGLAPLNGGWSIYMPVMNVPVGGLPQSGAKGLKGAVDYIELKTSEKAFAKKKKQYDFHGRYWLKQKFQIMEALQKAGQDAFDKLKGKKKSVKKEFKPLIADKDLKIAYAGVINKKIDAASKPLKEGCDKFFFEQSERVLKSLDKKKSKAEREKLTGDQILNADKETALSIDFITPYLEQYLVESGKDALAMVAPAEEFEETKRIQKLIDKRAKAFAESVTATTLEKLNATLAEGVAAAEGIVDLRNRVESVYGDFPLYRSELIARTEATTANNEGMLEGFKQSNVATGKEWINSGDSRVREEHEDGIGVGGEIVGLDSKFSNGLSYPSEPNCRCVIGPAFLE